VGFLRWLFGKPNKKSDSIKTSQDGIPANQNQEISNKTDSFLFYVDEPNIQDFTQVGKRVKLWTPKDNAERVFVFQGCGPDNWLGEVPFKYASIIIPYLIKALDYDAEIVELSYNTCKIQCRLISKEETEHRKEMVREAEETIIKGKALEKTNNEESVCLYRKAMEILKEIDQQCGKNFSTLRKQRFPINRLSLVLERQKKYKECLEEIEAYEKLPDKVGLYAREKESLEKRKKRVKKILTKDQGKDCDRFESRP